MPWGAIGPRLELIPPGLVSKGNKTMTIHAARVASPRISQDELLRRLVQANERDIADIVSVLAPSERARVAFFCYARGHLHDIGLAVAATCELPLLMQAAPSTAAGNTLFARSRQRVMAAAVGS